MGHRHRVTGYTYTYTAEQMSKSQEKRLALLEEQVKTLRGRYVERESQAALIGMCNRITNRIFELGSERVDLRLIAKLNAALGVDIMPLSDKAPRAAKRYTDVKGIKKRKP